jgi:hypothetical protein
MKKSGLIILLMCLSLNVAAQKKGYEIKKNNKAVKISLTDILGNWYALDSPASKISFININNFFVDIDGIKHGVGNYSFRIYGDSISVNGTAANWPPYDCTLKLLKGNFLEIEFYQFLSEGSTKMIYRR